MDNFEEYLKENSKRVNQELETYLKKRSSSRYIESLLGRSSYEYDPEAMTKSILEPAWYLLDLGGKRWRPALTMLTLEALGSDPEEYIEFSIIPEVIHNATLIHDDIEDNSPKRRNADALHIKFGIDVATNLGDFMYFFPMVALIDSPKLNNEKKNRAVSIYVKNMTRVSLGQAIDIAWHSGLVDPKSITEEKYLQMAHDKTGVLSRFACELGGALAGADDKTISTLGKFGATIGIAFQIQDDILNLTESELADNKGGVGDDISEGKITLMVLHVMKVGSEADKNRLAEILKTHTKDKALIKEAISIIDKYGSKEYSSNVAEKMINEAWNDVDKILPESAAKNRMHQLVEFLVHRTV